MVERARRHLLSLLLVSLALLLLVRGVIPAARAWRAQAAERASAEAERDRAAAEMTTTELWVQGLEEGDPALTARVRAGLDRSPELPGLESVDEPAEDRTDEDPAR